MFWPYVKLVFKSCLKSRAGYSGTRMVLTNTFLSLSALYPIFYHPHYLQKIFGCLKNGKNQLFTLNKIECAILPQFLHKCALRKLLSDVCWLGSLLQWVHFIYQLLLFPFHLLVFKSCLKSRAGYSGTRMVLTNTFLSLSALYPIFYHPHYLQKFLWLFFYYSAL